MQVIQCKYCGGLYSEEIVNECPACDGEGDKSEGLKELEF